MKPGKTKKFEGEFRLMVREGGELIHYILTDKGEGFRISHREMDKFHSSLIPVGEKRFEFKAVPEGTRVSFEALNRITKRFRWARNIRIITK